MTDPNELRLQRLAKVGSHFRITYSTLLKPTMANVAPSILKAIVGGVRPSGAETG